MPVFNSSSFDNHEGVHFFSDPASGLKAIIAIHSTALGPAAGGCRMWNYDDEAQMVRDALRLSRGMSYKNAMADIGLGGGKAVIWGDSKQDKSDNLFRAFGRAVDSLAGRYWTAEDVGISPDDMQFVKQETDFVAGLNEGAAASGDPSPVTARGVFLGIKECAKRAFENDNLNGRHILLQGVGHVGGYLAGYLAGEGAHLTICDVNEEALEAVAQSTGAKIVSPNEIYDIDADIFSPNALGGVINDETLKRLKVKVIAGGANNQLLTSDIGTKLLDKNIIYAPDYVINGGGIINVASEVSGTYDPKWVEGKLQKLIETLGDILDRSMQKQKPSNVISDEIAEARIKAGHKAA